MDTPNLGSPTPEPVRLPEPPAPKKSDDVIVLSHSTLYFFLTALVFFVAGFAVAWITFSMRTNDIQTAASGAAQMAVRTAIAEAISGGGEAAAQPTPVPRQNIGFTDQMPTFGPKDAKVVVVEFSDFQCPYCQRFYVRTWPRLKQAYSDKVRFVFRHMPLSNIHPQAQISSLAAECAKEQGKFWEYHDVLFSNQNALNRDDLIKYASLIKVPQVDQFTQCLDTRKYDQLVNDDFKAGAGYAVTGTPTFFVNGNILVGAQEFETFAAVIDQELKAAGQ